MELKSLVPMDKEHVGIRCRITLDNVKAFRDRSDEKFELRWQKRYNEVSKVTLFFRKLFKWPLRLETLEEVRADIKEHARSDGGWRLDYKYPCYKYYEAENVAQKLLKTIKSIQGNTVYVSPEDWDYIGD